METAEEILIQANQLRNQTYASDKHEGFVANLRLALELYMRLIDSSIDRVLILKAIASCYYALGIYSDEDYEGYYKAIEYIKRAINLRPDDGHLHMILGEYYHLGINDYAQAKKEYEIALDINPYEVQALNKIPMLLGHPDSPLDIEEAIDILKRLIVLEPDNPDYLAFLATLYFRVKKLQEAKITAILALTASRPIQHGYIKDIKAILDN